MQITEKKVVTLNYTLKDESGDVLETSSDSSFTYLHGAQNIIPGLENALHEKTAGDSINVTIPPDQAYGHKNDDLRQQVPREMFGEDQNIELGMQFHAQSPDGQNVTVTVTDIDGDTITVDGNHPFAGMALTFEVDVVDVRDALEEEISHGHVHGENGHDH